MSLAWSLVADLILPETMTPDHYSRSGIQPWDAMESWMTVEEWRGFLRGNVIKYIARYPAKGGIDDLAKASHYLSRLLESYANDAK